MANQRLGQAADDVVNTELDFLHDLINSLQGVTFAANTFIVNGIFNWTVPSGITKIFVTGVASGGGGGSASSVSSGGGGGGSAGSGIRLCELTVSSGEVLELTIPKGGAQVTAGNDLIVTRKLSGKVILKLLGGRAGASGTGVAPGAGGTARTNGGAGGVGGSIGGSPGADGGSLDIQLNSAVGGTHGGGNGVDIGGGGGGGSSIVGTGGRGASNALTAATNGVYGSGGGGASASFVTGGAGGDGYLAIFYFS